MKVNRLIQHLWSHSRKIGKFLSKIDLVEITNFIGESEKKHSGQICFAIEGAFDLLAILKGVSPRERALEVFAKLRIWDTERNNGILIYVLLVDHAVEIVADRGINEKLDIKEWNMICGKIEEQFGSNQFKAGVISGIEDLSQVLQKYYPRLSTTSNEIADEPVLI